MSSAKVHQRMKCCVTPDCSRAGIAASSWKAGPMSPTAREATMARSGSIELPEALAHEVLENGVELAVAIDRFAGSCGDPRRAGRLGCAFEQFHHAAGGVFELP